MSDRSAAFDKLRIPANKRSYIVDVLEPVLEPMVAEVLGKLPSDPVGFMINYLQSLKRKQDVEGDEVEHVDASPVAAPRESLKKTRGAVSAEAYGEWNKKKAFVAQVHNKSSESKTRLLSTLKQSFMFQNLEDSDLSVLVDAMSEMVVPAKTRIIKQGDSGDFLFVIEQGTLDCFKMFDGSTEEKLVKTCQKGDVFGELALLYHVPRAASVESRTTCVLWKLDRETFAAIVSSAASRKREKHESFLKRVPILASLDAYELSQVADALKPETFTAGSAIVKQGEPGEKFYILEEGECHAEKDAATVMEYSAGDYFGELALLNDEPRAASVISDSAVKAVSLDRRAFDRLLGRLQGIMEVRKYK